MAARRGSQIILDYKMVEKEEHRKEEMVPRSHYGNDIDYAHHAAHIFTAIGGSEKTQNVLNGEDHDTGRVQAEKDQLKKSGSVGQVQFGRRRKANLVPVATSKCLIRLARLITITWD